MMMRIEDDDGGGGDDDDAEYDYDYDVDYFEKCMPTWNTAFTKYKLNLMKTEVIVINRTPSQVKITLHDVEIKQVDNFKYIGCNVNTNGTIEEHINRRVAKYSQHVGMMYRLLKYRNVPL